VIKVEDYSKAAEKGRFATFFSPLQNGGRFLIIFRVFCNFAVCKQPKEEHPFLCLDLSYITALLTSGYKLQPSVDLHVSFLIIDSRSTVTNHSLTSSFF
jgi:hypothetical protein